ncbi:ATP-binding protein [Croceitalea sp. MTPC5]|uniref:metallophosphoesterase n=1 Tax=Croceitalea sp. MTPC5 TaxID=3056565 RepID=UPI002B374DF8|nr:ATP-binding protein [Croceitalea sp. MTPC5]
MNVLFLHISDIHLKDHDNSISKKVDKLFDSFKNKLNEVDHLVFISSGDIAFSGNEKQYQIAQEIFDDLKKKVTSYSNHKPELIVVPGNHDCNFNNEKEGIRKLAIKDFSDNGFTDFDSYKIDVCCEPQLAFENFARKNSGHLIKDTNHKLLKQYNLNFGETSIKILGYNSAWFSQLHETPGNMKFPVEHFKNDWELGSDDLVLSLIHHPLNWQTPENAREFKTHLEATSDIVLSGHEHAGSKGQYSNLEGNNTIYIESPVLQDSSDPRKSGYNLIYVDFNNQKFKIEVMSWDLGKYKLQDTADWQSLIRGQDLKKRTININEKFLKILTDPGASFEHEKKGDEISLEDLFIYPNVSSTIDLKYIKKKIDVFSSKVLFDKFLSKSQRLLILGEEVSGKSTLCKFLFHGLYKAGKTPILMNGGEINAIDKEGIKRIVNKTFVNQYHKNELDTFEQLDRNHTVLLIDDFHKFKTKGRAKERLINNLVEIYPNIIITGDKLMELEDYTKEGGGVLYEEFENYSIQEMGPDLRYELINKWNNLGSDFFTEPNELLNKNDYCVSFVNNIVKNNLIPSYPIFILSMLQSLSGKEGKTEYSMHGYYYQLLISRALSRNVESSKLGAYHNFMAEFCYFLFDNEVRLRPLALVDFAKIFKKFCDDFDITTLSINTMINNLRNAKLITEINGYFKISYPYVYYYFVAKYISDHVHEKFAVQKIEKLCERVFREEYSNIVMFLVHLEKSSFILDLLLNNSRILFKDVPIAKLENDIGFINKLVNQLPQEVLDSYSVDDIRKEDRKEEEEVEDVEREFKESELASKYKLDDDISELDVIARITRSLKTIEILGQLTKKHWAEIKGPKKLELTEETYLLGLRTLKFYFTLLEDNIPLLAEHIKSLIDSKKLKEKINKKGLKGLSNDYIFRLSSTSTLAIVKRISNAIGLEDLSSTFDKVLENHNYKSTELINLCIKLDHFKGIPENELEDFKDRNGTNYLCINVLQNMIKGYLYMYYVNHELKQSLCEKFGITMSEQRYIDATSKVRKSEK